MPNPNLEKNTVYRSLSLGGVTGGGAPCEVDVNNKGIIRIRPMRYDKLYPEAHLNKWKIARNGKTFEPLTKSLPGPFSLAYKKRVYSPNRIQYPLKRIDWDPTGERNPQNRGKSKYVRISWEEATDIIADEINRVHAAYGPLAILCQGDGHAECKSVHAPHGNQTVLLEKMGGYTQQVRNPDSWEGWFYGAKHVWGNGIVGMMAPFANLTKDITENSDMVLFWGCDPETTPWGFTGQSATRLCYFWSEVGIKQVYICPDLNYGAAVHADKWIPIIPNTDAALQLAIIYTWIDEDSFDSQYVRSHTVGFEKVADYVMGKEDGIPKTPAWASPKCGVPEWTVKALARNWARNTTSIAHYFGGSYIRGPYSSEPARLECILLGMQGLGKPGVHQCQLTYRGMPRSDGIKKSIEPFLKAHQITANFLGKQGIPKTYIQDAILSPPISYWGSGAFFSPVEDQFKQYVYPIAKKDGGTEVHMIWTDTPCRTTCWNDGNRTIEAFRNPKIETIIAQHPWLENDCLLADIILPANTTFEVEDIVTNIREGDQYQSITYQKKAIEPVGESKSDYEIVLEIAKKLNKDSEYSNGQSIEDKIKAIFEYIELDKHIDWEEFSKNQYYVFPTAKDWESDPAGLLRFYKDPVADPLPTPSGKLEFYSKRLAQHFPDDSERPPIPKWIEKSITHDERISSERTREFPLMMMSNHGRWRTHAQGDDITWTREIQTCKIRGVDGYYYEPLWIHPFDAEKRHIRSGDIVMAFNERGAVLCGALALERIMPGVVYVDHGARCDWIIPGKLDRGGAINLICPHNTLSKNCLGEATSGYLVEVKKVSKEQMDEWRNSFPDAFERVYEGAAGLSFAAWIAE